LKKEEFMRQTEGCRVPEIFDQGLLDYASERCSANGVCTQMDKKEHFLRILVWHQNLAIAKPRRKKKIQCVNKIKEPKFEWAKEWISLNNFIGFIDDSILYSNYIPISGK